MVYSLSPGKVAGLFVLSMKLSNAFQISFRRPFSIDIYAAKEEDQKARRSNMISEHGNPCAKDELSPSVGRSRIDLH